MTRTTTIQMTVLTTTTMEELVLKLEMILFAAQLDDKMWRLWMERANIECHSLAAPDFLLFQTLDLSYL